MSKAARGHGPGTTEYLSCYQNELILLWNHLKEKEKEKAHKVAVIWNQMGPPAEEQAK